MFIYINFIKKYLTRKDFVLTLKKVIKLNFVLINLQCLTALRFLFKNSIDTFFPSFKVQSTIFGVKYSNSKEKKGFFALEMF